MKKWKQRVMSLVLVCAMVLGGLLPGTYSEVQAAENYGTLTSPGASGEALSVYGGSSNDGAILYFWTNNNEDNQNWDFQITDQTGEYRIANKVTQKYIAAADETVGTTLVSEDK